MIIGVSGSPIVGGNTDRMVKAVLEKSGRETKFINLSTLKYSPCRACAHHCGTTNVCGVKDDLQPILLEIRDADALVLGSPIQHGNMTGWMFGFISRLWSLYQVHKLLEGRPTLFVSTGIRPKDIQAGIASFEWGSRSFKILGHIYFNSRTPPCYKCGAGNYCKVGGLWGLLEHDEEKLKNFKLTPDLFKQWEDDPQVVAEVEHYGRVLSEQRGKPKPRI